MNHELSRQSSIRLNSRDNYNTTAIDYNYARCSDKLKDK